MNTQVLDARRDVSGGYKVDVSGGERVGRVSSEWFNRPDDERFLSLDALADMVRIRAECSKKRLQREQDGSEVKSVQLERLIEAGQSLIERRDSLEIFRESAADRYLRATGSPWSPRTGSRVNHRHLTAAMIDSRDFLAAKRRADNEVLVPAGPKIAFSGGDTTEHRLIWARLDQVHAKHPDMVLMHGGSPNGAEKIAAGWADSRKVPQVAFKPDWTKHAKAAPFKRNDQMLAIMPIGSHHLPRDRHSGEPRRQGEEARYTESGAGDRKQVHILVKQTRPDLQTNLVINTNLRTYHMELRSTEKTYMASVSRQYPHDQLIALRRQNARAAEVQPVATGVDISKLSFRYRIEGDSAPCGRCAPSTTAPRSISSFRPASARARCRRFSSSAPPAILNS